MLAQPRKGYLLWGLEPDLDLGNPAQALRALGQAECVVACTAFRAPSLDAMADVLLPIAAFAETSGTFVNVEGAWQGFRGAAGPARRGPPGLEGPACARQPAGPGWLWAERFQRGARGTARPVHPGQARQHPARGPQGPDPVPGRRGGGLCRVGLGADLFRGPPGASCPGPASLAAGNRLRRLVESGRRGWSGPQGRGPGGSAPGRGRRCCEPWPSTRPCRRAPCASPPGCRGARPLATRSPS